MKIEDLLVRNEGKTLEFKQDLSSPQNILKTITAFANTAGGIILIGIEDNTKAVRGIENPLAEEERLSSIIADSILPRLIPDVMIINWKGQTLLAVEVFLSGSRPHYLSDKGLESGVYVRVGSTNRTADMALINELRRTALNLSYDEEAMPEVNPEAIDFRVASGLFSKLQEWSQNKAETLNIFSRHQGRLVPTVGGVLLFGSVRDGVSKLRNRVIGRVFKELNLIEQWGSGFQRMAENCREMNLPEPILEENIMDPRKATRFGRGKATLLSKY